MTRILSEILQAREPAFRMQLRQLEQISGHQNTDIKLSVEVTHAVQRKIHHLGLDKHDTTAEELYHALKARVVADDIRLERALRTQAATHVSAEANLMDGLQLALKQDARNCKSFAMKPAAIKRLLKKTAPKRLLKQLGYRSMDAMLRRESPQAVVAAANAVESAVWRRSWLDSYKQLKTADFEERAAVVLAPSGTRWEQVTAKMIAQQQSTVLSLPELGAIVLLPLPGDRPQAMLTATIATALHELNSVAALSNYLRASQVQPDFAGRIKAAASGMVTLQTPVSEQAMPWHIVQQYYARLKTTIDEDVFGPYVQAADFVWQSVEHRLAELSHSMEFWQDSGHLSYLHQGKSVSFNILDVAADTCNDIAYQNRSIVHAQQSLWHELTLRYLNRENLEQTIMGALQPQLALESVKS